MELRLSDRHGRGDLVGSCRDNGKGDEEELGIEGRQGNEGKRTDKETVDIKRGLYLDFRRNDTARLPRRLDRTLHGEEYKTRSH